MQQQILQHLPNMIIVELDKNQNIINFYPNNQQTKEKLQTIDLNNLDINQNYEISSKQIEDKTIYYLQDISKYKQTLSDLSSKKEELQAVFDLAANGISILDRNGMFLYANKFFQKMMGYNMEELKKESCISLSAPEYAKPSQTAVQKAIKYGSIEKFRKICLTKSGLPINASMSLSYLKSRDEIVMITSDITQDIQYQEELERQIEQEVGKRTEQYEVMCHQSRLAAMGEMINSIAHQWRQPLNGLGIIVQGLRHIANQDNVDKTMIKEVEDEIMEKVKYMSQTIDDFSTFFKMSKKKVAFDIIGSIHDAIRLIDVQLRVSNIEVSVDSKELQTLELLGFPNEFRQVILNMIHNSINAIEQNNINQGKINIITQEIADKICIKIHDNGGGIPKDSMENIFDPYFTTKEKGSGIGLYMSKIIIEHHMNGSLSVSNHKDGAEFTIEFQKGVLS